MQQWTLNEVLLFLEDPKSRCPDGSPNMNPAQMDAEVKRWQSLPALQKLREHRY